MTRNRQDGVYLRNRIIILIWIETSEILRTRIGHKPLHICIIRHSQQKLRKHYLESLKDPERPWHSYM